MAISNHKTKSALRSRSYTEKDYRNELKNLREYWSGMFEIKLFRIDTIKSGVKNLYGEAKAKDKKFLPPVTLTPSFNIGNNVNKYMSGNGINKEEYESFVFNLFIEELEENNAEAKKGDYIIFTDGQISRTFEITTASQINTSNTIGAFRPFYQEFTATLKMDDTITQELRSLDD